MAFQPALEFCCQTGSLSLEISVGAPGNLDIECEFGNRLQVYVYHQVVNGLRFHVARPFLPIAATDIQKDNISTKHTKNTKQKQRSLD